MKVMAANNRNKLDEYHLKILRELLTHLANKYCFDCHQRGPTYVNVTIGSFVCTTCSGMLRGLTPPHRVKSITMATFTPEEIEIMKSRGNQYCKNVWLGLHDAEAATSDEQQIKDFMIAKYEKKRYYVDPSTATTHCVINFGNGSRTPSSLSSTSSSSHNSPNCQHLSYSSSKTQNTCTIRSQQSKTSSGTSNGNSQLLASNFESPVTNTMPLVDPFSSPVDSSSSSEISFANFDNNPAFGTSKLTAVKPVLGSGLNNPYAYARFGLTLGFPSNSYHRSSLNLKSLPLSFSRWSIATDKTSNLGTTNGKIEMNVPPEDKYAALKDLDCQMKSEMVEKQQEEMKQKLGINTNGVNWSSLFSNHQGVSLEPSTPFNPFSDEINARHPTMNGSDGATNPFSNDKKADPWRNVLGDTNNWNSTTNDVNGTINPPNMNGKDAWNSNISWQNNTNVFSNATTKMSNGWKIEEVPLKLQVGAWPQTNGQHPSSNPFL